MKKKETIYAFIDSQNLNLGVHDDNWSLDWGKFRLFLRNKYGVTRAFLFIGYIERNQKLYDYLSISGYEIIFKKVLWVKQNAQKICKGNVDAEIVMNALLKLNEYDKAILVSGDGDFYCLIDYLAKRKRLLKIIVPNKRYSSLLKEFSMYILRLSDEKTKLEYITKKRHSRGKQC